MSTTTVQLDLHREFVSADLTVSLNELRLVTG